MAINAITLYGREEFCAELGIETSTWNNWVANKRLGFSRIVRHPTGPKGKAFVLGGDFIRLIGGDPGAWQHDGPE